VTGGAGFIGSNLVAELIRLGETVRILDNFSTGKRENLIPYRNLIEIIEGDIRSYHIVRESVSGIDFVFHQAALPSVPRSIKDPITTNEVNVGGTLNVLDAALNAGIKRVVFASSSSIYGDSEVLPKIETMNPSPLSPYATSKLAGEKYCQVFSKIYGLETVSLRYFNVFGPKQNPHSQYSAVIPLFIEQMKGDKQPVVFGDGLQSRDFTHVSNVIQANILASRTPGVSGEVFNVASGMSYTIIDLIDAINRELSKKIKPIFAKSRPADAKHSLADINKAIQKLSYNPMIQFHEGLHQLIHQDQEDMGIGR